MAIEPANAVIAQAAQQIYDAARSHKRSEGFHRKQSRTLMQKLDEMKRTCEALGITLTITTEAKENLHGPEPRDRHRSDPGPGRASGGRR